MGREELLEHLRLKGFSDKIVGAFGRVKREEFVAREYRDLAYEDTALPLERGSTISQPSTIAFMLSLLDLKEGQKILEVGSGCGYVLALIAEISKGSEIFGIEVLKSQADFSAKKLKRYGNVFVACGDGYKGLEKEAPFDRILVSAAAEEVPAGLVAQLKAGGVMVVPVKSSIVKVAKVAKGIESKDFFGFAFVPLVKRE